MNDDLLQDIKNTLESKEKELIQLIGEYEAKKVNLEKLTSDYRRLISNLEKENGVKRQYSTAKKDIVAPLLEAFGGVNELGMNVDQAQQYLKSRGFDVSQNTVSHNIKELMEQGKIVQTNVPAKRNKMYKLANPIIENQNLNIVASIQ